MMQNDSTMNAGLQRLTRFITGTGSVIDIGASDGHWTRLAMQHMPGYEFLLVDANKTHESALRHLHKESGANYKICAAGDTDGEINFFISDDVYGGSASYSEFPQENNHVVPMYKVSTLAHRHKHELPPPYILKLDTHGFEVPILQGAVEILEQTEAIIIEVYNFHLSEGCLTFHEMCNFLQKKGFRCVGLADPMYRQYDDAFWQMDLFFIRSDHNAFNYIHYK